MAAGASMLCSASRPARRYRDLPRDDTSPWNFVLADDAGRQVDVHAVVFDADGNGLYGPVDKGVMYPAASLSGRGVIAGRAVKCITGYRLRDTDVRDASALCERFGIDYPDEYQAARGMLWSIHSRA